MLYSSLHRQHPAIVSYISDDTSRIQKTKKRNSFSLSIPQANQIFRTLRHQMKSIYPFEMSTVATNELMSDSQQPYKQVPQRGVVVSRYRPIFERVSQHFALKYLIYDKFNIKAQDEQLFNQNLYSLQKIKKLKNIDYETNIQLTKPYQRIQKYLLQFNSRFQSGNLSMVSLCQGIYHLLLHNDVNTSGYTSWFYFSVKAKIKGVYKFVILNYGKAGWMLNQGVKICVYEKNKGWRRGGQNIACETNKTMFSKDKFCKFNSLYFEFQFREINTEVYFAYNIPYTYNYLCNFLNTLQQKHSKILKRKLAGISLVGNKLQFITITNFQLLNHGTNLPVIILLARTHPGQTVSSWILHQFLIFITSDDPQAKILRDNFVFKIFPMVNPDGVIHGNYRCSLSGRDLNRRWKQSSKQLFPEIYYIRNQIYQISRSRNIKMILDLHGHTNKKKVFLYGCHNKNQPHRCRLFPFIMTKLTKYFQFKYCNFYLSKQKLGTARISLYNKLKNPYIYTMQTSQFGTQDGHWNMKIFTQIARSIGQSIIVLFKIKAQRNNGKMIYQQYCNIQNQLINNTNLLKSGNQDQSGSQSEPSVDNIRFDKLATLIKKRQSTNYVRYTKISQRVKSQTNSPQQADRPKLQVRSRPKTNNTGRKIYSNTQISGIKKHPQIQQKLINYRIRLQSKRSQRRQKISRSYSSRWGNHHLGFIQKKPNIDSINYINLSLAIVDGKQFLQGNSCRTPNFFRNNNRGLTDDLIFKLSMGSASRKCSKFKKYN